MLRSGLSGEAPDGWRTAALLAAITAVGAALRFYGLDVQSLWNDELSTWAEVSQPTLIEVIRHTAPEHPPGYSLLLHLWTRYLGDSETLLRMPSAIAGALAIPATFLLGRKLYGETEALIAAALTAVLWMPVYYSQEARAYAMIILLAALSTNWLIDIARALLRRQALPAGAAVGYAVTAVAACYAHYFGLFFVALQGAFVGLLLIIRNGSWMRLGLIYAVVVLAYVPWLSRAGAVLATGTPGWLAPPTPEALWKLTCFMFSYSDEIAITFLVLAFAALLTHLWRTSGDPHRLRSALRSPTALLLLWVVAPVAIIYVRSVLVAPAFTNRSFSIVVPALYLLAARSITGLPLRRTQIRVVASVLVTLLIVHLLFVMQYYERQTKDQFRHAAQFLVERDDSAAAAVVLAAAWNGRYFDYYFEHLGSPRRVDRLAVQGDDFAGAVELIDEKVPDHIWLVAAHRLPHDALISALKQRFRLMDERRFYFAHAWRFQYKRKPVTH